MTTDCGLIDAKIRASDKDLPLEGLVEGRNFRRNVLRSKHYTSFTSLLETHKYCLSSAYIYASFKITFPVFEA
jgi:hypothetical protein